MGMQNSMWFVKNIQIPLVFPDLKCISFVISTVPPFSWDSELCKSVGILVLKIMWDTWFGWLI